MPREQRGKNDGGYKAAGALVTTHSIPTPPLLALTKLITMHRTTPIQWFQDEKVFLRKNFFNKTNAELLEDINSNRSVPVKLSTLLNQCQRMGLRRGIQIRWSKEDIGYLVRNYKRMGDKELAQKLTKRRKTFRVIDGKKVFRKFTSKHVEKKRDLLKLKRSSEQILAVRKRNIQLGLTFAFSKGKHAWNTGMREAMKEGEVRIWKDTGGSYKRNIKVNGRTIPYTRWFYINFIGPVSPRDIVFHIDFDSLNDKPENLEVRRMRRLSAADYGRALPLIRKSIDNHLNTAVSITNMVQAEKLEWHRELIRLKGIEKKIYSRLSPSSKTQNLEI